MQSWHKAGFDGSALPCVVANHLSNDVPDKAKHHCPKTAATIFDRTSEGMVAAVLQAFKGLWLHAAHLRHPPSTLDAVHDHSCGRDNPRRESLSDVVPEPRPRDVSAALLSMRLWSGIASQHVQDPQDR